MALICLKSSDKVLEPDHWWTNFGKFDGQRLVRLELDDHYSRIAAVGLQDQVPEHVAQLFENARNTYLYAFFAHRLLMVADLQLYVAVEFALREKAKAAGASIRKNAGMKELLNMAIKREWIVDDGFEVFRRNEAARKDRYETYAEMGSDMQYQPPVDAQAYCRTLAESFPGLRNMLAHGSNMLHPSVIGSFEIAADLIHQLFPTQSRST